ncbi:MAG: hypothetical protein EOM23_06040 [Candidatus Moranbacteria bacterium]|nr:hypothetical protein [Candidatus Moranbacteria bacterium]
MYKIYKIMFIVIAEIYIKLIMPLIDIVINFVILPFTYIGKKTRVNVQEALLKRDYCSIKEKKDFLVNRYKYVHDPVYGLFNWNWRSIRSAAFFDFKGDCDKFAFLAKFLLPYGKRYSILPLNPKFWKEMHVVYVYRGCVYSSGYILSMDFEEYLSIAYGGIDYYVAEY